VPHVVHVWDVMMYAGKSPPVITVLLRPPRKLGLTFWKGFTRNNEQPFYSPLIQDKPVLSQRRDLLEQPLHFYELDVLPATQAIMSKHYRKVQWFGRLLF